MSSTAVVFALLALAGSLLVLVIVRPAAVTHPQGRLFALVTLLLLPLSAALGGLDVHVERSKTVAFCTSCHVMEGYGASLHIDDVAHLPATHWQFGRVPRETACFACHTNYTMYGDVKSKLRGLRHVYVQYLGHVPDKIKLYSPYHNRECLHCHDGARSFVEGVTHHAEPGRFEAILANKLSCLTASCHGTTHTVADLAKLTMWPAKGAQP
jgi:cytochrome c-type protein NapC